VSAETVLNPVTYKPLRYTPAELLGYQLTPATWDELADWCSGEKTVVDGGQAIEVPGTGTVRLGEWLVWSGDRGYRILPADLRNAAGQIVAAPIDSDIEATTTDYGLVRAPGE
jgi:hypothetical protein